MRVDERRREAGKNRNETAREGRDASMRVRPHVRTGIVRRSCTYMMAEVGAADGSNALMRNATRERAMAECQWHLLVHTPSEVRDAFSLSLARIPRGLSLEPASQGEKETKHKPAYTQTKHPVYAHLYVHVHGDAEGTWKSWRCADLDKRRVWKHEGAGNRGGGFGLEVGTASPSFESPRQLTK